MNWWEFFSFQSNKLDDASKIEALAAISQTVAALLSLIALIMSLWVFYRQQRLNRWQLRLHREDHIIQWSQACIQLMAEVEEHLNLGANLPSTDYIQLRSRLSARIDEGRLYFPNLQDPTYGELKHEAYKGHRQEILDHLVDAYDFLRRLQEGRLGTSQSEVRDDFNKLRRAFVSAAQSAIDPRTFNRIRA
ncbi:MAG: hypothetical protein AAGD43_22125 [Pseudomonadota bacterium]